MGDIMKDIIVNKIIFFAILFIPFLLCVLCEYIECHAKAKVLNLACEYDIISGCVITKENGKKILLEQLRYFDE